MRSDKPAYPMSPLLKNTLVALLIGCYCATGPSPSYAGGIASAFGKATATRVLKPRDVVVRRSQYPEAAAHIEHAQKHGQPTVLTLDRAGALQRRKESLRYIPRKENSPRGMDRDEYPPAMTKEGGFDANVRYISARDNRGVGTSLERRVRDLPDGQRIRILVAD